jgi:hypothetical protein
VDRRLGLLCDERMVLKTFETWPERRLECLRESVARVKELEKLMCAWDPQGDMWVARNNIAGELENIRERFEASAATVEWYLRSKDDLTRVYSQHKIPFDWGMVKKVQESALVLARYITKILRQARPII